MSARAPDEDEGFLTRWSRRKRTTAPDPVPEPAVPEAPAPQATEPDTRPRDPETGEVLDEEAIKALPPISDIGPATDLSVFLRRGVPEALRREALRAMWVNDPVIRGYVSPALDYAYDYNVPGGAPGYGPLSESDIADARATFTKLVSTKQAPFDAGARDPDDGAPDHSDTESQAQPPAVPSSVRLDDVAAQHEQTDPDPGNATERTGEAAKTGAAPVSSPQAVLQSKNVNDFSLKDDVTEPRASAPRRRRGGGATPA